MKRGFWKICLVVIVCMLAGSLGAEDGTAFESFYSAGGLGFWGWAGIVVGTLAVGAITFFTCGGGAAAAPAWMATVGGWIGSCWGLSGAAAANFGLALLGGGAVAAGGLGIAGGVAVLSSLLTFGIDTAVSYSIDKATESWSYNKFIEANKMMMTLPIPRNDQGSKAYEKTMEYLHNNYNKELPVGSPENQEKIKIAIDILYPLVVNDTDKEDRCKDYSLLSLFYFQINEFDSAIQFAEKSIYNSVGDDKESLPSYIWAVSQLATENLNADFLQALRKAYYHEPENKLMPLMTACCMDRMMYRYHYGQLDIGDLCTFGDIITQERFDEELAAQSLAIFVTRCLIELKRTHQDFYVITKNPRFLKNVNHYTEVKRRFEKYEQLINMLSHNTTSKIKKFESHFPDSYNLNSNIFNGLMMQYQADLPILKSEIQRLGSADAPNESSNSTDSETEKGFWEKVGDFFTFG